MSICLLGQHGVVLSVITKISKIDVTGIVGGGGGEGQYAVILSVF